MLASDDNVPHDAVDSIKRTLPLLYWFPRYAATLLLPVPVEPGYRVEEHPHLPKETVAI